MGGGWDFSQFNEYLPRPEQSMMHRVNKAIVFFLWDIRSTFTDGGDEVHVQVRTPRFKYLNLYFHVEDNWSTLESCLLI